MLESLLGLGKKTVSGVWRYVSAITASSSSEATHNGTAMQFGAKTVISGDGTLAAIGSPGFMSNQIGTIELFDISTKPWTRKNTLANGNVANDRLGFIIAVSRDGKRIVGLCYFSTTLRVYKKNDNTGNWEVEYSINPGLYGRSFALSKNGEVLAYYASQSNTGYIQIYRRNPATNVWALQKQFSYPSASDIAVSGDGKTVLFMNGNSGQLWISRFVNNDWTTAARIAEIPAITPGGYVYDFATNEDGTLVLIGAQYEGGQIGAAYLYRYNGTMWSLVQKFLPDLTGNVGFGTSVAMTENAEELFISAPIYASGLVNAYKLNEAGTYDLNNTFTPELSSDRFGSGLSVDDGGTNLLIGSLNYQNGNKNIGIAYLYQK